MIRKVDLVMWTKNGAETLPLVLKRISEVIPNEFVNKRIIVDDSSIDCTVNIAKSFNWSVYNNEKGGIANGASQALAHVESPFFISIEQDVILADNWWNVIPSHLKNQKVIVAQGVRVPTHPALGAIYRYGMRRGNVSLVTIDNNIYNTEKIKEIGGMGRDYEIYERVRLAGYKWITDRTVVSKHLRPGIKHEIKHNILMMLKAKNLPIPSAKQEFRIFATSPVTGVRILKESRNSSCAFFYPILRAFSFQTRFILMLSNPHFHTR